MEACVTEIQASLWENFSDCSGTEKLLRKFQCGILQPQLLHEVGDNDNKYCQQQHLQALCWRNRWFENTYSGMECMFSPLLFPHKFSGFVKMFFFLLTLPLSRNTPPHACNMQSEHMHIH